MIARLRVVRIDLQRAFEAVAGLTRPSRLGEYGAQLRPWHRSPRVGRDGAAPQRFAAAVVGGLRSSKKRQGDEQRTAGQGHTRLKAPLVASTRRNPPRGRSPREGRESSP